MSSCEPCDTKRYSEDIGWRVVCLRIVTDLKLRIIAERLCLGYRCVARIWKRFTNTENVMKQSSSKSRHTAVLLMTTMNIIILGLVFQSPTIYLHELCHSIEQATNIEVSIPTICCLLRRYGLTRKKIRNVALQRS